MAQPNTQAQTGTSTTVNNPPLGQLYNISGRHLLLHRSGSGEPAVVIMPGSGMVGYDFLDIHDLAAQFTTSVIYDRGGTGWSDQVTLPRTSDEITDELRSLLREAGVPAPYLLVGHSLGGGYARRYAQRFPNEVAGLLLLESYHEDYDTYMPKQTLSDQFKGLIGAMRVLLQLKKFYSKMYAKMFATWPDEVRKPLIDWHLANLMKTFQEFPASQRGVNGSLATELRNGGKTPDVPLIVICALGLDPSMEATMSRSFLLKMNEGKRTLYTALANSVPRGEYREIEDAGHSAMHIDRPDAIIQAIRDLINKM